ncbi:RWD-domain-containing protein [Cantharellus anzutake]|uniref:RWD-domain-containing protein n=1 Tax=Cantharellus anzutake TaxID=1750568 RepID=UPI0019039ABD|nr:RWD-domain-containing protein [Cantharellus anzutake]KAF8326337.1 RWD-domain-containing protein [Cantharellus anzutake]
MSSEVLAEEYEVLSSIYPDELEKVAEDELKIRVEPAEQPPSSEDQSKSEKLCLFTAQEVQLTLFVKYPPEYPDKVPGLAIHSSRGSLSRDEEKMLLNTLHEMGEESLGMAMVFTLVSQLQESLGKLISEREELRKIEAAEKARRELEAETARTRGTPVTSSTFSEWKKRFDKELAAKVAAEDEERIKAIPPKEREEYKRNKLKPTGRQLFEKDRNFGADDEEGEEGAVSVDISQYERNTAHDEVEEVEDRIHFSDSD